MGPLLIGIYLFVLAMFIGFEIINKIPPTLHTPLMSGANAISGITLVGALLAADTGNITVSNVLGFLAIVFAMTVKPTSDDVATVVVMAAILVAGSVYFLRPLMRPAAMSAA